MLKDWWHQREQREQIILGIGAFIVLFLIVYFAIWSPLETAATNAQQEAQQHVTLLSFIKHAKNEISALQAAGFVSDEERGAPVLVVVEQGLGNAKLSKYIKQVQQPQKGQVKLMLQNVPFDHFMDWLQTAWLQHAISVSAMAVIQTSTPGVVNLTVTLSRKS